MDVVDESTVIDWLRELGYRSEKGESLSRAAVGRIIKGNNRVWAQLVSHIKATQPAGKDTRAEKRVDPEAQLKASIDAQTERNKKLRESIDAQRAHLEARVQEVAHEEARQVQAAHHAQNIEFQLHAVEAYHQRLTQLLELLEGYSAGLQQFDSLARTRGHQSSSSLTSNAQPLGLPAGPPSISPQYLLAFNQVCANIKTELQTQATSWLASQHDTDTSHHPLLLGGAGGGSSLEHCTPRHLLFQPGSSFGLAPSTGQAFGKEPSTQLGSSGSQRLLSVKCLGDAQGPADASWLKLGAEPATLLACMTQALQEQTAGIAVLTSREGSQPEQASPHHQQLQGKQPVLDPRRILRARQQAHVDCFLAAEEAAAKAQQLASGVELMKQSAQPLMAWPYNQLKLQEARLGAEVASLRWEQSRLQSQQAECSGAEAGLQELYRANQASAVLEQQLNRLVLVLITESSALIQKWVGEGLAHKAWSQRTFLEACHSLAASCSASHDLVLSEAEAAAALPLASLLPHPLPLASSGSNRHDHAPHQGSGTARLSAQHGLHRTAGMAGPATPPRLGAAAAGLQGCHDTSCPFARGPAAVPAVTRFARALAASAASDSSRAGAAGVPGAAGSAKGFLGQGGLGSSNGSGSGAAGLGRGAGGSGGGLEPGLLAVLRAAGPLDTLAALRCPSHLLLHIQGVSALASQLQLWATRWASHELQAKQTRAQQEGSVLSQQQQLQAMRSTDSTTKLKTVQQLQLAVTRMQSYITSSVRQHLEDYKTLPATGLLPDVQYGGLNAAEWQAVIQELHQNIRIAQGQRNTEPCNMEM
ncbi:hypothetical protein V8C86DRAFT_859259 [Haematococcus lacustris]